MVDYYPFLIEHSIEFKRFSRRYLSDLKSKKNMAQYKGSLVSNFVIITYDVLLKFS